MVERLHSRDREARLVITFAAAPDWLPGLSRRGRLSAREVTDRLARTGLVEESRFLLTVDGANAVTSATLIGLHQRATGTAAQRASAFLPSRRLALVCRRADAPRRLPAALDIVRSMAGLAQPDAVEIHRGSGAVYRVMAPSCVARFPAIESAIPRCQRNYMALEELSGVPLPFDVPRSLGTSIEGDLPYFVESRVRGRALEYLDLTRRRRAASARAATAALMALQRATLHRRLLDEALYVRLFLQPSRRLTRCLPSPVAALLEHLLQRARVRLVSREISLVSIHGDFKIGNLLWSHRGDVEGLVDWDLSTPSGLPTIDAAFYPAFDRSITTGAPFASCLSACLSDDSLSVLQDNEYGRFAAEIGIDRTLADVGHVMALVHFGTHHPGLLDDERRREWCDRHLSTHLEAACRHAIARLDVRH